MVVDFCGCMDSAMDFDAVAERFLIVFLGQLVQMGFDPLLVL